MNRFLASLLVLFFSLGFYSTANYPQQIDKERDIIKLEKTKSCTNVLYLYGSDGGQIGEAMKDVKNYDRSGNLVREREQHIPGRNVGCT